MKKIWQAESNALIFTAVWILLIGIIFQNWVIACLLPLLGYIGWIYSRLYQLEKWLARGTKTSQVFDDEGFIGYIIRHIYLQKKVYIKQKKRAKEILNRLKTNISALPDATVLLNQNLEIEWINDPAKYLLDITRYDIGQRIDNLIRNPEFQSYLINPDDRPYLELESPLDNKIVLQFKIVSFGKNQRLLIIRNISDQKQLQEALKNFIANASHELQTPLTAIIGHLEMLEMDVSLSDTGKKSVSILQQQSQRMKQLIQDLLMLSKVESYQLQPDEGELISITDVMTNVMSLVGNPCTWDCISCNTPEGLYLLGVRSEIEGICINLIENALKHTPENTRIEISWEQNRDGEYIFRVADKGPGISTRDFPHITDRYYRGSYSTAESISGSGLGLAIVQQAAHKHGAKLEIKSRINQGSTFSVVFPNYRVIKNIPAKQQAYLRSV